MLLVRRCPLMLQINRRRYNDVGELLPEEKEILSGKIFSDDDLEEMKADGLSKKQIEQMIQHEASWRVPNRLSKRYFGEEIGRMDPDKVLLTKYTS